MPCCVSSGPYLQTPPPIYNGLAESLALKTSGDPDCQPYAKTRRFYEKRGFVPVLVIDPYPEWGEPMALYVKPVC